MGSGIGQMMAGQFISMQNSLISLEFKLVIPFYQCEQTNILMFSK